ncbi:dihydrofolate reductase family protein [Streptomyces sp. NPDC005463]|uniref:dihydrofolate reductase family protein n=1 Tax=Streptomyces sp. NPDC005463 TaxID=3154465 RepID=UPI0033B4F7AC
MAWRGVAWRGVASGPYAHCHCPTRASAGRCRATSRSAAVVRRERRRSHAGRAVAVIRPPASCDPAILRSDKTEATSAHHPDAVKREKRDVFITGRLSVVHALMADELIDEYRLLTFPSILGTGQQLFPDDGPHTDLECLSAERAAAAVSVDFPTPRSRVPQACPPPSPSVRSRPVLGRPG